MNFKGKDCVSHVPKCLAEMDKCVDNSCKQRAEYLCHSFIIVHIECSQWQASFIREKSVCLTVVSLTEQVLREISKYPQILGELSMYKQCVPGSFFSAHAQEPGNKVIAALALSSITFDMLLSSCHWCVMHPLATRSDSKPLTCCCQAVPGV